MSSTRQILLAILANKKRNRHQDGWLVWELTWKPTTVVCKFAYKADIREVTSPRHWPLAIHTHTYIWFYSTLCILDKVKQMTTQYSMNGNTVINNYLTLTSNKMCYDFLTTSDLMSSTSRLFRQSLSQVTWHQCVIEIHTTCGGSKQQVSFKRSKWFILTVQPYFLVCRHCRESHR